MLARIAEYVRKHHIGLLALFIALGGTAYAANTVGSADVINNSLKSVDLQDAAAVRSQDVVNNQINAADLADIGFAQARTLTLQDTAAPSATFQDLFNIGQVSLTGVCDNNGSQTRAAIEVGVDAPGPTLVSYDNPVPIQLQPFDVQFVGGLSATTADGTDAEGGTFAILGTTSASGVAALRVNPAQGRCWITIHALG